MKLMLRLGRSQTTKRRKNVACKIHLIVFLIVEKKIACEELMLQKNENAILHEIKPKGRF